MPRDFGVNGFSQDSIREEYYYKEEEIDETYANIYPITLITELESEENRVYKEHSFGQFIWEEEHDSEL